MSKVTELEAKHAAAIQAEAAAWSKLQAAKEAQKAVLRADGDDTARIRCRGAIMAAETTYAEAKVRSEALAEDVDAAKAAERQAAARDASRKRARKHDEMIAAAEAATNLARPVAEAARQVWAAMEALRCLPGSSVPPMNWTPAFVAQLILVELHRSAPEIFALPFPVDIAADTLVQRLGQLAGALTPERVEIAA